MKTELEIGKTEDILNDFLKFCLSDTDTYGIVYSLRDCLDHYIKKLRDENLKVTKGPSAFENPK